jgi:hypothetical protein
MRKLFWWLNAITWAIWVDLGQPKWLLPIVKYFSKLNPDDGKLTEKQYIKIWRGQNGT